MAANATPSKNALKIKKIHHIELWVGNAKQAAYFYRKALGFSLVAHAGLETGLRDRASYVLQQGNIRLVLSSPLVDHGPITEHLARHGDSVRDVAFEVADAHEAFHAALSRDARPSDEPSEVRGDSGAVKHAAIQTYGDTVHSLISLHDYSGPFLPGFVAQSVEETPVGLKWVDHVVGNVEMGKMNYWADWYGKVLGFHRYISFDDKDITTDYSALMSVVMSDDKHVVKFPINEPAPGKRKSQIQEYLDYHGMPGVQHVAFGTHDILGTVRALASRGVEFLTVPQAYYESLLDRVGPVDEPIESLAELGILVDRDDEGYLLQLFTKPVEDRPTLFFEIIQRKGSKGFGKGNFRALFESIEREQERRGNLHDPGNEGRQAP